jgi:hypothetical protein
VVHYPSPRIKESTLRFSCVPNVPLVMQVLPQFLPSGRGVLLTLTLDFEPSSEGTNLKVTVQMVSFVGPGMIQEYESGNKSALENLSSHLRANP